MTALEAKELETALEDLREDYGQLLAIAKELAAKCLRGTNVCTACGACGYLGGLVHNEGCAVGRLSVFVG